MRRPGVTGLSSLLAPLRAVPDRAPAVLRALVGAPPGRHVWTARGRAHIAVRGVHEPGTEAAARTLTRRLEALAPVRWAETAAPLGRVVVAYDESATAVADLVEEVEEAERAVGLSGRPFQPLDHPADPDPLLREAFWTGAAATGAVLATAGRISRLPRAPVTVATVTALVEATPALRAVLERRMGPRLTETALAWTGTVMQALAHRPWGLAVEAAQRLSTTTGIRARRRAWGRLEQAYAARPAAYRAGPVDVRARPGVLPDGPIERTGSRLGPGAAAAYTLTLAATRSPNRSLGLLAAGIPQAARRAREAFAAQLERSCAGRGVLVLDPAALRRLDRLDAVVLDASVLLTGDVVVEEVLPVGPGAPPAELYHHAHALVDLEDSLQPRERDGWQVRPLPRLPAGTAAGVRRAVREHVGRGATVLGLHRGEELVGVVAVVAGLDPLAEAVVATAGGVGTVHLAGVPRSLAGRLGVESVLPGDGRLPASVRDLQVAGHGVLLVSSGGAAADVALAAADVGVGVDVGQASAPWSAHLLCATGAAGACLLLDAVPVARQVSRRAVRLASVASAVGAALALLGSASGAVHRAMLPVTTASALGLAGGTWYGLSVAARPPPLPADRTAWHAMPADTVLRQLRSSSAGLTAQEAARRHRPQAVDDTSRESVAQASLEEAANPVSAALVVSATLSALIGSLFDAALIAGVLLLNVGIGGVQRFGTDRSLRRLVGVNATRVRVLRDGEDVAMTADRLVPGDVVTVTAGDAVPADCRLFAAEGLELDESSLTGEAHLVPKSPAPVPAQAVADRHSMLYEGTAVAAGAGRAVVVATGERTEIGRTVRIGSPTAHPDGVQARLRELARVTVPLSAGAGVALLASSVARGEPVAAAMGPSLNLAIAAVPEGLPFIATVAELAAVRRLSAHGALVRRPTVLETLGRVDVLCFDKTGTLTEGRISLGHVSDGLVDRPVGDLPPSLREVVAAAVRGSPGADDGNGLPHPTDRAVVHGARALGIDAAASLQGWRRLDELPFEPSRGYHAVLGHHRGGHRISVKGAPEVVLHLCATWRREGVDVVLDPAGRRDVERAVERLAGKGFRVLAIAEGDTGRRSRLREADLSGLRLLGLVGLADVVRPTAAASVEALRAARVQVVMVTGDHPGTADAIAAELGAVDGRRTMTGPELDALDDEALARQLPDVAVFARVTPAQKARIVEGLRAAGRVVAVTGDGANDAPAIRLADAGFALGVRATSAAREAADVVITDDRIETVTDAILEGRAMWASVRDALALLLGGNLGEVAFTLAAGLLGGTSVLGTRQLLLVNLLTDVLPATAIALRPAPGLTRELLAAEGPESSLGSALVRDIVVRAVSTSSAATLAWALGRATGSRRHASTVGLVALVAAQLGQTLVAGARSPLVVGSVLASLLVLVAVVQVPGVSQFFGSRPLGVTGWGFALGAAAAGTVLAVAVGKVLAHRARVHDAAA